MRSKRTSGFYTKVFILVALYPWIVSYAPIDSLGRELAISMGAGEEVRITRDCQDNVVRKDILPYTNLAASYSMKLDENITGKLTAGGGVLSDNGDYYVPKGIFERSSGDSHTSEDFNQYRFYYVGPSVSADWRYFGIGAGFLLNTGFDMKNYVGLPVFNLRVGSARGFAWHLNTFGHDLVMGPGWVYTGLSMAIPIDELQDRYFRLQAGVMGGPEGATRFDVEFPIENITVAPGFTLAQEGHAFYGTIRYRF